MIGLLEFVERVRYTYERMRQTCKKIFEKGHPMSSEIMNEGFLVKRTAKRMSQKTGEVTAHSRPVHKEVGGKHPVVRGQTEGVSEVDGRGDCNSLFEKIIMNYKKYGFFI
jgi:hypothetical protein